MKAGLLAAIGFAAFILFAGLGVFAAGFRFKPAEPMKRLVALIGGAALFGGVIGGAVGRSRAA